MSRYVGTCTWDEVPHLSREQKDALYGSYPLHMRDARTKGVPQLGSGAIYPIPESDIVCDPIEFPLWWPRGYGMDVGWNRTAAVWGCRDPSTDVVYLYAEHYRGQDEPASQAAAIRGRGAWIPGVIDPASRGRGQTDGKQLFVQYVDLGLNLTVADNGVEAGLFSVMQRMTTGRLKVFRTLANWLSEYRMYRRDDKGHVVKTNDHAMDATRYLVVSGIERMVVAPDALKRLEVRGGLRVYDPHSGV